nr:MAG TPA: Non-structural protein 1 Protein, Immune Antagonist [Caudoviricetes sp.]
MSACYPYSMNFDASVTPHIRRITVDCFLSHIVACYSRIAILCLA